MVAPINLRFSQTSFYLLVITWLLYLTYQYRDSIVSLRTTMTNTGNSWSSPYEGWFGRAKPYPSPETFSPSRENLAFAVLHHAPADPDGFTLALFSPDIAVDAMGHLHTIDKADFAGLTHLAQGTLKLPPTGLFMNTWKVAQRRTDNPIERLYVPKAEGDLVQTSVQGYEKGKKELKAPVGDIRELPDVLHEFFGLVAEARTGYERGREDKEFLSRVKAVLGNDI
ncbi:hypothetical protein K474DRAFT_1654890 [Panus rudis PR-1116 ss-1]|nr:hypothetical protein K474DRAFT_1654890 [Panus rudis PR-1116 ss-1]